MFTDSCCVLIKTYKCRHPRVQVLASLLAEEAPACAWLKSLGEQALAACQSDRSGTGIEAKRERYEYCQWQVSSFL